MTFRAVPDVLPVAAPPAKTGSELRLARGLTSLHAESPRQSNPKV